MKKQIVKLEIGITPELERRFIEYLEQEAAGSGRDDAKELRRAAESVHADEWDELARASFPYFVAGLTGFQDIGGAGADGALCASGLKEDYDGK